MTLRTLLLFHAFVTFTAGIVLILFPALIPSTIGVTVKQDVYILSYFLGCAEIALAYLSYVSRKIEDIKVLGLVCWTFIVFHISTACMELYAMSQGVDSKIFLNVVLRIIISTLFFYFGLTKRSKKYHNS
jgi:hypothetical protein